MVFLVVFFVVLLVVLLIKDQLEAEKRLQLSEAEAAATLLASCKWRNQCRTVKSELKL
jgi:hypothetical protein